MKRMKMESEGSSKTLAVIYQTMRHHIPEEPILLAAVQTAHLMHYGTAVDKVHE
jgi:hypothetical protein